MLHFGQRPFQRRLSGILKRGFSSAREEVDNIHILNNNNREGLGQRYWWYWATPLNGYTLIYIHGPGTEGVGQELSDVTQRMFILKNQVDFYCWCSRR